MNQHIRKIKDLYYYEQVFSFEGEEIPFVHYYKLTNIQRSEENDEVISVDVEVIFEPEKYLRGEEEYYSKIFSVLQKEFTPEILLVLQDK